MSNDSLPLWRRLLARFGNPLEWSQVDRTLLVVGSTLLYEVPYVLLAFYLLRHPDLVPFLDSGQLRRLAEWIGVPSMFWWGATIAAALVLRRRYPESRVLVHTTVQFWWISISISAYFMGTFTSPFSFVAMLGAAFLGFLIYDTGPVLLGVATGSLILIGTTIAEQAGYLPYAPLFTGYPYKLGGHLSPWWILAVGGPAVAMTLTLVSIAFLLITNWREREQRLAAAFEELRQTKDQLVRAESLAAVGSLVTGAAHELRNPLASSGALFQSLKDDIAASDASESHKHDALQTIEMALKGQKRAALIAERLYELTDKLAGRKPFLLLGESLEALAKRYERLRIECPVELDSIRVPGALIESILPNLLDNAFAAGGAAPPRLEARLREGFLEILVTDEGRGIPKAIQGEVFKPFFTDQKAGEGHGVGLGLYIAYELTTRMGGAIRLESEEGKGTRVTVRIPAS